MSTWTARTHELHTAQARQLADILLDIDPNEPAIKEKRYRATAAGDERKLRGIPAIARGVPGAIPGSSPHHARLDNVR